MSFYTVTNPTRVVQSNPTNLVNKKLDFLNSGFQQADGSNTNSTIDDSYAIAPFTVAYTPANLINRYIERTGTAGGLTADLLPTAAEIITALNGNQTIRADSNTLLLPNTVSKGFYFDFTVYNETDHDVQLIPGTGVRFGFLPSGPYIQTDSMAIFRLTVTNTTSGSEAVYINELSCCGYSPLI